MSARTVGLWLWLLVGGLAAAVLVWQWRHPPHPPTKMTNMESRLPELPVVLPLEPFHLPPLDQYGEAIARPLFIAGRRPESPPPEEEALPATLPAGPEQTFLLFGVVITPEATTALVRPEAPNARTARVRPGETVGEWRLEAVFPDRVVLRKDQATQELKLVRPRKPTGPRAARAPPKPVRDAAPSTGESMPPVVPQGDAPPPVVSEPPQN